MLSPRPSRGQGTSLWPHRFRGQAYFCCWALVVAHGVIQKNSREDDGNRNGELVGASPTKQPHSHIFACCGWNFTHFPRIRDYLSPVILKDQFGTGPFLLIPPGDLAMGPSETWRDLE